MLDKAALAEALRPYEQDLTFGSTGSTVRGIVILTTADRFAETVTGLTDRDRAVLAEAGKPSPGVSISAAHPPVPPRDREFSA